MMDSIEKLKQRLLAYKALPEDHYRAIGEHLLDVLDDIEEDVSELKKEHEKEVSTLFLKQIDQIARGDNQITVPDGQYVYTVTVAKVHKTIAEKQTKP